MAGHFSRWTGRSYRIAMSFPRRILSHRGWEDQARMVEEGGVDTVEIGRAHV